MDLYGSHFFIFSELLDKVQSELGVQYPGIVQLPEAHFSTANFISHLFQGQLVSQVSLFVCVSVVNKQQKKAIIHI